MLTTSSRAAVEHHLDDLRDALAVAFVAPGSGIARLDPMRAAAEHGKAGLLATGCAVDQLRILSRGRARRRSRKPSASARCSAVSRPSAAAANASCSSRYRARIRDTCVAMRGRRFAIIDRRISRC
jgi:hypothetical protein